GRRPAGIRLRLLAQRKLQHSQNARPRRLRLMRHNRELLPQQRIQQRTLAGIRPSHSRHKSGTQSHPAILSPSTFAGFTTLHPRPPPPSPAPPSCRSTAAPPSAAAHPLPPRPAAEYARRSRSPARPPWLRHIPSAAAAIPAPACPSLPQTPTHPPPRPPRLVILAATAAAAPQIIPVAGSPRSSLARHTNHPLP